MMGRNHKLIGIASGFSIAASADADLVYILAAAITGGVGAMIPDIDHHGSTISRKLSILRLLISPLLQHRGPTHSLLAIVGLFFLGYQYQNFDIYGVDVSFILWGFIAGYASHIMADMLTKSGVVFLWPIQIRFGIPLIRTNSKLEFPITVFIIIILTLLPYSKMILALFNWLIS